MTQDEIAERKRILLIVNEQIEETEEWCELMRQALWQEYETLTDGEQTWIEKII
jgi:2-hydroxychromene-2-carboxylate isomerase